MFKIIMVDSGNTWPRLLIMTNENEQHQWQTILTIDDN